ncbi:MAG: multicomponent Na+:H+ antiporter subunit F [Cellvibrionaceae bacterium]|jgi:multicomponent Na+:H+ antiporter subunit F
MEIIAQIADTVMVWLIVPLLSLSIVVTFIRFVIGPSLPDRIVALDILSGIAVGMMAAYAVQTGETVFLDIALVVALITFLGTIGFAYYIDRRQ